MASTHLPPPKVPPQGGPLTALRGTDTCQNNFEQGIALSLHLWPVLTFAVENSLGGSDAAGKRDWFAGCVSELFPAIGSAMATSTTTTPQQQRQAHEDLLCDVESRLLQVMDDEFETVVDDGSAYDVAEQILVLWRECSRGVFKEVEALRQRWEGKKGAKVTGLFKEAQGGDQDTDWDTEDDDEDDDDEEGSSDVDMDGAPALVSAPKEKAPPEVDEDGFMKVTRKKR
ncbi:uncharacterized protein E0L32_001420 [Thyridium curvatum]|uniref:Pre-rRNA-processing protein TSR2 n=1 Tax=Thyridium curvatum TaxID=1093900 RepID=A0A507AR02_9PEZI|nr:uncharacterized protein E0L32_001420 [Thyridium curvatum]TPX10223.1 hypothetical protein E0L32_001420 [Thyridium curvatum]